MMFTGAALKSLPRFLHYNPPERKRSLAFESTGSILDGKYEVVRRLAGGGMSEVYLVRHLHLDEQRVVKVLRPEDAADPTAQARFLRAARTATQIKHANVAILYDIASLPDGSFYMVWEYIDGEDVGRWISRYGPFPLEIALDLATQALRGLEAIHSHGVIHRDISPDNLMLARDVRGKVRLKIIDLGLVKDLRNKPTKSDLEVTQVGMFMGKLRYCSPEQAGVVDGAVLDRRTDLYSFAAVFYEMLCGKPPFESETPHGFVFKRLTEDPLPLVGRAPGVEIPAELDRIVRKGLERDRNQRYATAVEFIQALESLHLGRTRFATQEMPQVEPKKPVTAAEAGRSPSQLTREERDQLLAQIQRAATRVSRTQPQLEAAEAALAKGDLEAARRSIVELEALDPKAKGLIQLKDQLESMTAQSLQLAARLAETEALLTRYLTQRQVGLARFALDSLLELSPEHPQRARFEEQLAAISAEADVSGEAQKILERARQALALGELDKAQREQRELASLVPAVAATLAGEIEAAKRSRAQDAQVSQHHQRFESFLAKGDLDRADAELAALEGQTLSRSTVTLYRDQLLEARRLAAQATTIRPYEARFAERVSAGDWLGAQEVALELERLLPNHPRAAGLFAEAEALRARTEHGDSVRQGTAEVERWLAQNRPNEAALALKVLLKLDPHHPRRAFFEKKIEGLKG
ncbi:MAG TPA: protein kinase [Thermoanaerobaculia bacterium]|nr:protein kinase [Thermoanaerobaculia bacterium]